MDSGATSDEDYARDRIREALLAPINPERPIKTMSDFLNLVRKRYLAPELYEKHEDIAIEMWSQRRHSSPPTPAPSSTSPDSKASDALADNLDDLPSLEATAEIGSLWIAVPTRAECAHLTYKPCNDPGSYIRADSMRNHGLEFREEGSVVIIHWDPRTLSGIENSSEDKATAHTACRVVSKEKADSRGMNVDLVLGKDFREDLEHQAFSVLRNPSQNLTDIMEEEEGEEEEEEEEEEGPETPMLAAAAPLSKKQPRVARLRAPIQFVVNHNYNGPTFVCRNSADFSAALGRVPLSEHAVPGPDVAEMVVPKVSEGPRKKRKIIVEHESRPRDRI